MQSEGPGRPLGVEFPSGLSKQQFFFQSKPLSSFLHLECVNCAFCQEDAVSVVFLETGRELCHPTDSEGLLRSTSSIWLLSEDYGPLRKLA